MILTPEQITSVKGLIGNYLFDLEQDVSGGKREPAEIVKAIAHVLDPQNYPVTNELKDELEELIGSFNQPQILLNFFKNKHQFAHDDATVLNEIKKLMHDCLLAEVKAKDANHKLVAPSEKEVVQNEELPVPPKLDKNENDLLKVLKDFVPGQSLSSLLIYFKANSVASLRAFIAINLQLQKYHLPSYQILNEEFSQIYAVRSPIEEVIVVPLTPFMRRDYCLKFLSFVPGLDGQRVPGSLPAYSGDELYKVTHRDSLMHNLNFHYEHHNYPLVMKDAMTINHEESMASLKHSFNAKLRSTERWSAGNAIIHLLLMRPVEKWTQADLDTAKELVISARDAFSASKKYKSEILAADLENAIGAYYECHGDSFAAIRYYEAAHTRLKKIIKPEREPGGITINPYMKSLSASHSQEQTIPARCLSSFIVICDNLISLTKDSNKYVGDNIDEMRDALEKFKAANRYTMLKVNAQNEAFTESKQNSMNDDKAYEKLSAKLKKYEQELSSKTASEAGFTLEQLITLTNADPATLRYMTMDTLGYLQIKTDSIDQAQQLEKLVRILVNDEDKKKYHAGLISVGGYGQPKPILMLSKIVVAEIAGKVPKQTAVSVGLGGLFAPPSPRPAFISFSPLTKSSYN